MTDGLAGDQQERPGSWKETATRCPDASRAACQDSLGALDGRPALGVLVFVCMARRGVLVDRGIKAEIDQVAAAAGGAPVAGFYTYGEIARTRGINGFHNQTLVALSMA